MISKATLKSYQFETIEEYFDHIVDSKTNGQRKQCKELYIDLSAAQKKEFRRYFTTSFHYEAIDCDTTAEKEFCDLVAYIED